MAEQTAPGEGSVFIELVGEPEKLELKCSLQAAISLCGQAGGLEAPFSDPTRDCVTARLTGLDIATMALIIRVGLGAGTPAVKALEDKIFRTGLYRVREQISPFIGRIKNGGKPLLPAKEEIEGEGGDEGDENPPKLHLRSASST